MAVKKDEYKLYEVLKKVFGFDSFKGNQEAIINNVLHDKDTFVIMPTGGGKSLCYQLPALIKEGTAIIISPLIALMKNQVDSIRSFGTESTVAHFMNSSLTKQEIVQVKQDIISGETKMLYVAPETITKDENIEFLKSIQISFYAIDEAHCISEWGHDFRPEYRRLRPIIEAIGQKVPVIALTATATPKVQQDIQKNLAMADATLFKASFNRPNLYYEVRPKTKNVVKDIIKYIKGNSGKSGIVYCLSRKKVEELAETLVVNGIKALPYHAGLDAQTRRKNQDDFLMEEVDVIVATIAFGMGIDKPDVRYVIHHDIPKSLEGYYQETGRSGRDDGEGNCVAFYSYDDIQKLEKFMKGKPVAEQEIAKQLLLETVAYAESSVCRRKQLLHYFGEISKEDNCQNCDNCLHPKKRFEGKQYVTIVLETVLAVKQQFKQKHIINIIMGKNTAHIKSYKHNKLRVFGAGSEKDEKFWNAVVRQTLIERLLLKDIDNYGLLKVSPEGTQFLKKPFSIMLVDDHDYENIEEDEFFAAMGSKTSTADKTLFALLKDLRKEISRKEKLPPFVIFQDPSLEDMAIQYPVTVEELKQITGVGLGKALKYGTPFLDLIKEYVEENEIIRPMDMVVKSVVNKSGLKVYIIQNIDRKLVLEDIAYAKNLSLDELLTEIESIVSSGTKIDLNYYIDEYVDPYHQEEIFNYFREAESDSVEEALTTLGEDEYTEEEIRLMRDKIHVRVRKLKTIQIMQEDYNIKPEDFQVNEQISAPGKPELMKNTKGNIFRIHLFIELILFIGLIVLFILFFMSKKSNDHHTQLALQNTSGKSVKVVFINIDSLNNQYLFVKKLKIDLEATGKKLQSEILSEQAAFEKEATDFQKKAAANLIPEDKAKVMYDALMQKQQALADKKEKYTQQVAEQEQAMHLTLLDTVTNFLKRYNRSYNFDYILGYANSGQILLASETLDITGDIVKELNKEYQEKGK